MSSVPMARSTEARWRSLPTRLSTMPAMRTRGSKLAKPSTDAAADCACPATSRTSSTGRRRWTASSAAAPSPIAPLAGAIEQAHGGFDDQEIGAGRRLIGDAVEQRWPHGPTIEIEAGRSGSCGMEGGVDIVGAAFRGTHGEPAAAEGGDQRERDGGLAGAGARGRDEKRFGLRAHVTSPSQGPWPRGPEASP